MQDRSWHTYQSVMERYPWSFSVYSRPGQMRAWHLQSSIPWYLSKLHHSLPQRNGQKAIDIFGKTCRVVDHLNSTTSVGGLRMNPIHLRSTGFSRVQMNSLVSVKLWTPYPWDLWTRLQVGAGPARNLGKSLPQTDRNQTDYLLHNYGHWHLRQWNSSNWVSQMNCEMTKKQCSPINRIKGIRSHGCIGLIVVTRHHCSIVKIWANAIFFLKVCRISVLRNTKKFVLGIEDVWAFWFEMFEHHTVLESFSLPIHTALHGCTKSVSESPFLQVVLDRISDKCRLLPLLTLNTVALGVVETHSSHGLLSTSRNHMKLEYKKRGWHEEWSNQLAPLGVSFHQPSQPASN